MRVMCKLKRTVGKKGNTILNAYVTVLVSISAALSCPLYVSPQRAAGNQAYYSYCRACVVSKDKNLSVINNY